MHTHAAAARTAARIYAHAKPSTPLTLLLLALAALLAAACGPGKGKARLEGRIDNISQADVYIYCEDGAEGGVDTVRIEDGRFTYERTATRPVLVTLLYPNFTQTHLVMEPGKTVRMRGEAAHIGAAEVTGTEENRLLSDFRATNNAAPASNQRAAAAQFVRDHPATLAAVAVFRKYFDTPRDTDPRTALPLLDALHKAQPSNAAVTQLCTRLRPRLLCGTDCRLPAFSAKTLGGATVDNATFAGHRFFIVFCAAWSGESISMLRTVNRSIREGKYGDCRLLAVSLDPSADPLRRVLATDSLSHATIVWDGKAFATPLAQKTALRYVPSVMEVDARGVIRRRDITSPADLPAK